MPFKSSYRLVKFQVKETCLLQPALLMILRFLFLFILVSTRYIYIVKGKHIDALINNGKEGKINSMWSVPSKYEIIWWYIQNVTLHPSSNTVRVLGIKSQKTQFKGIVYSSKGMLRNKFCLKWLISGPRGEVSNLPMCGP